MPIEQVIKLVSSLQLDSENINTWKNGVERALKKYIPNGTEATGEKCENCGSPVVYQEGCLICKTCGTSKCGQNNHSSEYFADSGYMGLG